MFLKENHSGYEVSDVRFLKKIATVLVNSS